MRFGLPPLPILLPVAALFGLTLNVVAPPGRARSVGATLSLSPKSAEASTFIEMSVADLVSKSNLVVAGTPLDQRSVWEDSEGGRGRRIVTYTRLHVDSVLDNRDEHDVNANAEVWIRTLGGAVGDIGQHVDGEAILEPAAPALLFLHRRTDGTHGVVGMSQGHFPLARSAAASAPGAGEASPLRILAPRALGRLVGKLGTVETPGAPDDVDQRRPARLVLPGKTLADATTLILMTRRTHAQ